MVQSRGGEPAFPDSAFSSGRCSFPGQVEQGLCVTPAKLLLFPEVVFKAEKESGQGPCVSQWLAGRFVQETADCTLCDNHSSVSLSLPLPLLFPPSLSLLPSSYQWKSVLCSGEQGYGSKTQYDQNLGSEEAFTEEDDSKKGEGPPLTPQGQFMETF